MRESLDLQGDEGLEGAIEGAFDVRFTDDERAGMVRVGDIHAVLMTRFKETPGACATSMSFYRLRRALSLMGVGERVGPDTVLPPLFERRTQKRFHALAARAGLRLPSVDGGPLMAGCVVLALLAVALLAFGLISQAPLAFWAFAVVTLTAIVLGRLDRGRVPSSLVTVGDLARATAPINFGRLARQGAQVDGEGVWKTLGHVIGDIMDIPSAEIGRETFLGDPQKAIRT